MLTVEQSDLVDMCIRGESITNMAKTIGKSRQTIYDWLKKDYVKAEVDRRRQELTRQGNAIILKDLSTYIRNVQALAMDDSDKRTALAANQYLINRIYGNTKESIDIVQENIGEQSQDIDVLSLKLSKFRKNK